MNHLSQVYYSLRISDCLTRNLSIGYRNLDPFPFRLEQVVNLKARIAIHCRALEVAMFRSPTPTSEAPLDAGALLRGQFVVSMYAWKCKIDGIALCQYQKVSRE